MNLTSSVSLNIFLIFSTICVPYITAKDALDNFFYGLFVHIKTSSVKQILVFFGIEVPMFVAGYLLQRELLKLFPNIHFIQNSFQFFGIFYAWQFFIAFSFLPRTRMLLITDLQNKISVNYRYFFLRVLDVLTICLFIAPLVFSIIFEYNLI